jgi:hypothetical protein
MLITGNKQHFKPCKSYPNLMMLYLAIYTDIAKGEEIGKIKQAFVFALKSVESALKKIRIQNN